MKTQEEILLEQVQILIQHRNELDEIKKDLTDMKHRNVVADLELMNLPTPLVESKERTTRQNLVDYMRKISWRNAVEIINLWRILYKEYHIRYNVDLKSECKKYNMSKIMYAEKFNHLEYLYALAVKLYG